MAKGQRAAKGRPRDAKRKPRRGQGRPKAAKAAQSPKRTPGYWVFWFKSDFEGKIMPKASESRKSNFLKTELSLKSGANFQREGQAKPGQKGLTKRGQAREGLLGPTPLS